jgi:hypothetical protein
LTILVNPEPSKLTINPLIPTNDFEFVKFNVPLLSGIGSSEIGLPIQVE